MVKNSTEREGSPLTRGMPSILGWAIHLVVPFILLLALLFLHRHLEEFSYKSIVAELKSIPDSKVCLAFLLTLLNYSILISLDRLALRYVKQPLPWGKSAFVSIIGYAFSQMLGFSWVSGGSVRFRFYSAWGIPPLDVARMLLFGNISIWIGFITVAGASFLFGPIPLPALTYMRPAYSRVMGLLLCLVVFGYLLLVWNRKKAVAIRGLEFPFPTFGLGFHQVMLSALDWIVAASVLYVLTPSGLDLSFSAFLGVYSFAALAGLISQVPGGLGVFESLMLLSLSVTPANGLIASLAAFRIIYYMVPFIVGLLLFGGFEIAQHRQYLKTPPDSLSKWTIGVPYVLSGALFLCGLVLLISGNTPSATERIKILSRFVPLPLIEISHFMGSLVGVILLILAWGLSRRIDFAYRMTLALLTLGIVVSILKGFDIEEAAILGFTLLALLPCAGHFHRKSAILGQPFTRSWIVAIALAVLAPIWLGFFAYRHVDYSADLWWRFALEGEAPRFMRASVGVIGTLVAIAYYRLIRPARIKILFPNERDLEEIAPIVANSSRTVATLAYLGDKALLLNPEKTAFVMYGIENRSWVSMGDPIGQEEDCRELLWEFRELCDRYDGYPVFYQVSTENLHYYLDLGLTLLKLGEEAAIPLRDFTLDGGARKDLRYNKSKMERDGTRFEIVPVDRVSGLLDRFEEISEGWLSTKNTREKRFSLAFFKRDYIRRFPAAVVWKEDRILAFANVLEGNRKSELSIDLMRYDPISPKGIMEYLLVELLLWGRQEGFSEFNLGMAPLSGLENRRLAPLWNRLGSLVFRHGEHFYNFEGLRAYKEKFDPEWRPRYLACPGGLAIPRVLGDIASLISGGVSGLLKK